MRRTIWAATILWGCATQNASHPPAPGVDPRSCSQQLSLTATSSDPPTQIGPLALDTGGVDLCFHLDPGMFLRARFDVETPAVPGPVSSVAARLEQPTFVPITDGDDVGDGTQTSMRLDWLPPNNMPSDVVVWLHATDEPVTTAVSASYFDPLD